MPKRSLIERAASKGRRVLADRLSRRMISISTPVPIVSFTFDDAPKTAFDAGRAILKQVGARATYFVSLGLLDTETEVGRIASAADLARAVAEGNELGCHTFDHLDAWHVSSAAYIASVHRNREALHRIIPGAEFTTFAYPKSGATASVKSALRDTFVCCRGGGQVANVDGADLKLLKACFLDRRTGIDIEFIHSLVDYNAARRGWLIFATHDVTAHPSPFGCTPDFLEAIAQYVSSSGALVLPVGEACSRLQSPNFS
ncbi:MAG: polysaccharide deacetylase family protein [Rhodospirillales bacterium]|nr:polysaccharide deacetylase family protein [Rhodospirillales bacterium]